MHRLTAIFAVFGDGFDFSQWCLDIWQKVSDDKELAVLSLIALCLCKMAFGKKHPPQRSRASLDLPAGECGYIQIGEDDEDEEDPE